MGYHEKGSTYHGNPGVEGAAYHGLQHGVLGLAGELVFGSGTCIHSNHLSFTWSAIIIANAH
jgi:hypothetical protein